MYGTIEKYHGSGKPFNRRIETIQINGAGGG
jgi:hypothetical protein